jgi:VWFA-related protein
MVSPVRLLGLMSIAGSLVLPLSAQQAPPVVSESIDVRVVNVEAVVTDRSGQRVRGLKLSDLRLLVDGTEVPVEFFTEIEEGKTAAGPDGVAPAPGVPGMEEGRSFLVFLDDSFAVAARRDAAIAGIEADLGRLGPQDRMAVLAFDGKKVDVLCKWTADRGTLTAALAAARRRPTGGGQRIAQNYDMEVRDVDIVLAAMEDPEFALEMMSHRRSVETASQAETTTAGLAAALEAFEAPPGRKVMFLVSAGWQVGKAPRFYGAVAQVANQKGYTLYPVDTVNQEPVPLEILERLAGATGGKVVQTGARRSAFAEAVEDAGSYYSLGFTPAWKGDDRGHRILVEARQAGLTVRSRQGFSDISRKPETALRAESLLYFNGREEDKRLRIELGKARPAGRGQVEVPVTLGVPVAALRVAPADKGFTAEAPLSISIRDEQGGRADLPGTRLRVTFQDAPSGRGYARFQTVLKLRKAPQHIIFTVNDLADGAVLWGEAKVNL